ncbi:MAG: DUF2062 domain-containing protein [Verrucomicrobiota bacterium]
MAVAPRERWWQRWFVAPVLAQLGKGISVQRISWTIALGMVIGIFPVMGTTTVLCLLVGWGLRLNHVVMQVFKEAVYPLHLALILVFIRLGERVYGAPLISFSIPELLGKFKADPILFARDFGMAAWHGVSAWLLIAPVAAVLIKWAVAPAVRRLAESLEKRKEVAG